jgi:hypothetical protein
MLLPSGPPEERDVFPMLGMSALGGFRLCKGGRWLGNFGRGFRSSSTLIFTVPISRTRLTTLAPQELGNVLTVGVGRSSR